LATVLCLCVAGCGTTATIVRTDGGQVEGRISGGSFDEIWLVDGKGRERRIPRNEIVDIDHPGAIAAGAGVALLVLGLLSIHDNGPHCTERGGTACMQAFAPAAIGVFTLAWGGMVYSRSVSRAKQGLANAPEPPPSQGRQAPPFPSYAPSLSAPVLSPQTPVFSVPRPPAARVLTAAPAPPPAAPAPPPAPTTPLPAVPQRVDDEGT
jgi:hypothetical protein